MGLLAPTYSSDESSESGGSASSTSICSSMLSFRKLSTFAGDINLCLFTPPSRLSTGDILTGDGSGLGGGEVGASYFTLVLDAATAAAAPGFLPFRTKFEYLSFSAFRFSYSGFVASVLLLNASFLISSNFLEYMSEDLLYAFFILLPQFSELGVITLHFLEELRIGIALGPASFIHEVADAAAFLGAL